MSEPPSLPSIVLPAIRMATVISTNAANSLVLKNYLVSVVSRRAVLPTRPESRLWAPVDPVVTSVAAMWEDSLNWYVQVPVFRSWSLRGTRQPSGSVSELTAAHLTRSYCPRIRVPNLSLGLNSRSLQRGEGREQCAVA